MKTTPHLLRITADNVEEHGFFCARNRKEEGYRKKQDWLRKRFGEGLVLYLLQDEQEKDLGFIEYIPGEYAWRPVQAGGYLFIHCIYLARRAHQCPWHAKAARALAETARETGIDLHIREIRSAKEAQHAPSGFGAFALLHDGKLLADHYVSRTRFRNIIRAEGCLR